MFIAVFLSVYDYLQRKISVHSGVTHKRYRTNVDNPCGQVRLSTHKRYRVLRINGTGSPTYPRINGTAVTHKRNRTCLKTPVTPGSPGCSYSIFLYLKPIVTPVVGHQKLLITSFWQGMSSKQHQRNPHRYKNSHNSIVSNDFVRNGYSVAERVEMLS